MTEADRGRGSVPASLVVTVICHADAERIGERFSMPWLTGASVALSRAAPAFGAARQPLADRGVSRSPLVIHLDADHLRFEAQGALPYLLGGLPLRRRTRVPFAALGDGCALRCGRRVLLWIEAQPHAGEATPGAGALAGGSDAIEGLRRRVTMLAPHRFPVALRGEADTGCEAVARALHAGGGRPEAPFVAARAGVIAAAADVEGEVRSHYARARGGLLFIEDVDRLSPAGQTALLRLIELDEHDEGPGRPRLVTASAVDLAARAAEGAFLSSLVYRLGEVHLDVPPLRRRRADIAPLFVAALHARLDVLGRTDRLAAEPQWLTPQLVEALLGHDWPGNLRELDNVALEVALGDGPEALPPTSWGPRGASAPAVPLAASLAPGPPLASTPSGDDRVWAVDPDVLRDALRRHGWRARQAADDLGVARNTVYAMMGRLGIRRPSDLSAADIAAAVEAEGSTDIERVAQRLEVSSRGLTLRLNALGLTLGE